MEIFFVFLFVFNDWHLSLAQPSPYSFRIQYIGHIRYVTPEEEAKRDFCTNFWCTNDAHYLFTKSSQYADVDPCVDFKNFSVNHVDIIDRPDDRDFYRGFATIVQNKYLERLRKVVAADFDPVKDNRVIRVMKNTFAHCVKSAHVLRHVEAHKDLVEHLWSINGSPFLGKHLAFNTDKFDESSDFGVWNLFSNKVPNDFTNESAFWSGENFNISRYFEIEPWFSLNLFFDLKVGRCGDDVCLREPIYRWDFDDDEDYAFLNYHEMFRTLDDAIFTRPQLRKILADEVYWPALRNNRKFLENRVKIQDKLKSNESIRMSVGDLQRILPPELKIDVLKMINSELMEANKLDESDKILIYASVELLKALARNVLEMDKSIIADTFDVSFTFWHRYEIISRFQNDLIVRTQGTTHGWQRWEACLRQKGLQIHMYPALLVMYERERALWDRTRGDFDRDLMDERADIVGSAEKFIAETVDEFKKRFLAGAALELPSRVAIDVLSKLKGMKIVISLQSKFFPVERLEGLYAELNLRGEENFMTSLWEIRKFHRKLRNEKRQNWRCQVDETTDTGNKFIEYDIENGNILFISPEQLIYPNYHPLRPRFFNMATLFANILVDLYKGVKFYVSKNYGISFEPINSNVEIAYEHYKQWLKNNTEQQIGANLLTSEQLFWVAIGVRSFRKYHETVPRNIHTHHRLLLKYWHVYMKEQRGFQDAFRCNLTEEEQKEGEEFSRLYNEL